MASSKRKRPRDSGFPCVRKKSSPELVCPKINSFYKKKEYINAFGKAFMSASSLPPDETLGSTVSNIPFKHCCLPNFISDEDFLKGLKTELTSDVDYVDKNNDLYKFKQSDELKNIDLPHVTAINKAFETEIFDWMKEFTGISLEERVDLSASMYSSTDVLLCHDDEYEGRRIAFILYLVPEWSEKDGGTLDLFPQEKVGHPCAEPTCSIIPKWNTFVFFEVTQQSFHQVSEIINEDKNRLSLSGWFHGPDVEKQPREPFAVDVFQCYIPLENDELVQWINPSYFDRSTQRDIRGAFERDSEIELHDFLIGNIYQEICAELEEYELSWKLLIPPNKRRYEVALEDTIPPRLKGFVRLLRSDPFFLFISLLTGLDFHPNFTGQYREPEEALATCCMQLSRWRHGFYSLICDQQDTESALDLRMFFNCNGWHEEFGGFVSYLAKNEDEELLSVSPNFNCMAMVFRDEETVSFVKYVNHQVNELNEKGEFYCLTSIYKE